MTGFHSEPLLRPIRRLSAPLAVPRRSESLLGSKLGFSEEPVFLVVPLYAAALEV